MRLDGVCHFLSGGTPPLEELVSLFIWGRYLDMYGGFCGLWALMNGDGDGVAEPNRRLRLSFLPAFRGGLGADPGRGASFVVGS